MRTLRLTVAYDGTAFHGWQIQPGVRTVQGELEEALKALLEDPEVRVAGAGRTDAGVHARGQVASFTTPSTLPAKALVPLLGHRLPPDVRVRRAAEAPAGFHARHSARARRYAYRMIEGEDVLLERYAWSWGRPLPVERLDRLTRRLERDDDFAAFQGAGSPAGSTRCHVRRARWMRLHGGARFDVVADRFLYHMVRNVVGTVLGLAADPDGEARLDAIVAGRDRRRAGRTAPPHGLCLEHVAYGAPA